MLTIQLLGAPEIRMDDSGPASLRGQKAWGLLAYLALSEIRQPPREHLAELLFAGAADPLGALRWNLSELRRAVGPEALPPGSAAFVLPADGLIDVEVLTRGTPQEALSLQGLGRELLEGIDFEGSPAFETWLLLERGRLMGAAAAALREAALDRLAARRPAEATPLARRLVELDPYDENFQELLIRSYAQAGDRQAPPSSFVPAKTCFGASWPASRRRAWSERPRNPARASRTRHRSVSASSRPPASCSRPARLPRPPGPPTPRSRASGVR